MQLSGISRSGLRFYHLQGFQSELLQATDSETYLFGGLGKKPLLREAVRENISNAQTERR
jgi:hypothetical protein